MYVGERATRVHHRFEEMNRPVVVLDYETLPGACQQELSLPGHRPPETIE
jgi:hypothetical protein